MTGVCHVRIAFDEHFALDYRADWVAAELMASNVGPWLDADITIDDHVRSDMPSLPCQQLWQGGTPS